MIQIYKNDIYILAAARTPIGRFNGVLAPFSAPELGGKAIETALQTALLTPEQVEMVTMGCVVSAGSGEAPAKQAALHAGLSATIYSRSIENVCGSAMEAIISTADALLLGRIQLAVAGGMESRTNAPYLLEPRFIRKSQHYTRGERLRLKKAGAYRWQFSENVEEQVSISSIVDATAYDGLFWPLEKKFMREYALAYAKAHGITLEQVNEQASLSHQKARTAQAEGYFESEIASVGAVSQDDPQNPMARVLGFSRIDRKASEFIDAPVQAINELLNGLERAGYPNYKFEILEINEAFGIQLPVFVQNFMGKQINVNGGAIALGHPVGAAGARLLTTMLHAMKRLSIRYGITAICFGGGGSYALAVELV